MDFSRTKKSLSRDFEDMLKNAKELIEATSGEVDQKTKQARERLEESLASAHRAYEAFETTLKEQAQGADKLVRDKPYQAMGLTFVAGLLLGWIMGRK